MDDGHSIHCECGVCRVNQFTLVNIVVEIGECGRHDSNEGLVNAWILNLLVVIDTS